MGGGEPRYCAVNRMTAAALIVTHLVASGATAKRNSLRSVNYTDAMQMANLHRTCDPVHVTWCALRAQDTSSACTWG